MKIQGPWTKDKRYKATKAIKIVVLDEIMKQQAMEKTSLTIETQHMKSYEGLYRQGHQGYKMATLEILRERR